MISWIQNTFQKHFKWLFLLLLVVVIIGFVFVTGATSSLFGGGHGNPKAVRREFFGVNLNSREGATVFSDARLSITLNYGEIPIQDEQLQPFALGRYTAIALADSIKLPPPTEKEIVDHIRGLAFFRNAQGLFDNKRYTDFRDQLRTNPRISEADVDRVIIDDIRVDKVQKLLAGPGYTLPADVIEQLRQADTRWTLDVASLDYASFNPAIKVDEAVIKKYFDDNALRYEIPAKVSVRYLDFPAAAWLPQVTVTDDEARDYYHANAWRFPKPETKAPALLQPQTPETADAEADFAAVKPQVIEALRQQKARTLAAKAASDVSLALFGKVRLDALPAFIESNKLTVKTVPPLDEQTIPAELGGSPSVMDEARKLSADQPYSDAITTPGGAAVLVWQENIPSRQPAFAEVRERVTADWQATEKRRLFNAAGVTVRAAIEAGLKSGKSFTDAVTAAAQAAHLTAKVDTWKDFTRVSPPQGIPGAALQPLASLDKGQVSEMTMSAEQKGILVHVAGKVLPEAAASSPRYAELQKEIAAFNAGRSGGEQLNAVMEAEYSRMAPVAP
ncbi:hypothetical protein OPIT5_04950 [Opitutaceae bacterium TAV5]|nr:hypothetical protein OPIT5_04950 [Opitutaceae bacterium TAV5]